MKLDSREMELLSRILDKGIINKIPLDLNKRELDILNQLRSRIDDSDSIRLFVDGAADLNKKKAGIGGIAYCGEDEVFSFAEYLPDATNNQAEYQSLIYGLDLAINKKINQISIFMDSELVVRQINGVYRVKNERMIPLHKKVKMLLGKFSSWEINHVRREKNTVADKLSKEGLNKA